LCYNQLTICVSWLSTVQVHPVNEHFSHDNIVQLIAAVVKRAQADAQRGDPFAQQFLQEVREEFEASPIPLRRQQGRALTRWDFDDTANAQRARQKRMTAEPDHAGA
jgi:hypothetical protein